MSIVRGCYMGKIPGTEALSIGEGKFTFPPFILAFEERDVILK
jgi:hypothetical protein